MEEVGLMTAAAAMVGAGVYVRSLVSWLRSWLINDAIPLQLMVSDLR